MRSFAEIKLVSDTSEIPVRFNLLRRAPGFLLDWYVRKFNPFAAESAQILGERGFSVTLPLTARDAAERPGYFGELAARTLYALRGYGVGIVLPPAPGLPGIIPAADGRLVLALYMGQAVEKTLKLVGKGIKTAEALLIDGDRGLALAALDNIYPHVNYLTVITDDAEAFADKCRSIYADCGLNVGVSGFNRSSLAGADIIINTRGEHKFDYYYKRGAVYFELAGSGGAELASKRGDLLLIDGLRLCGNGGELSAQRFECGLFSMSRDYARLKARYDARALENVSERIKSLGYTVTGINFLGKPISTAGVGAAFKV